MGIRTRSEALSVLEVDPDASTEEDLRKAYKKLALKWYVLARAEPALSIILCVPSCISIYV